LIGNWIGGSAWHEIDIIGPDLQVPGAVGCSAERPQRAVVRGNYLWKRTGSGGGVVRWGSDGLSDGHGEYRFEGNRVEVMGSPSVPLVWARGAIRRLEMLGNTVWVERPEGVRWIAPGWVGGSGGG
jgi:hypothetical protein